MKHFTSSLIPAHSTYSLAILILFFVFTYISFAETPTDSLNKDSQKYLSFYETVDGEQIHWEANFFGDEIISIYKNGKQIPDDLVADYKDKVYDQLDEMRFGEKNFSFQMPVIVGDEFNFNFDELNKELEEMKKSLPKIDDKFDFHYFDSEEFKKEMDELKKELEENKARIYEFKFDDKEFKEQMEKLEKDLKENLPKLKKFKFEFDVQEKDSEV